MNSELPNKIIRLMSPFISDRTITVKINDEMSDKVKLNAGTPQGLIVLKKNAKLIVLKKNGRQHKKIRLQLFGEEIDHVEEATLLGVTITKTFNI